MKPLRTRYEIKSTRYGYEQILGKDYPITNQISVEEILELHEFPLINSRNFLVMQSGVGDTGDTNIYHPN